MKLLRDYDVCAKNLIDLGRMAVQADGAAPSRLSLAFLVGRYLKRNLKKGAVRMSDWELKLTQNQINYAASDAYSGLQVYEELERMAENATRRLYPAGFTVNIERPSNPADLVEPDRQSHPTLPRFFSSELLSTTPTASTSKEEPMVIDLTTPTSSPVQQRTESPLVEPPSPSPTRIYPTTGSAVRPYQQLVVPHKDSY
jgi:hypothetical protein